MLIPSPSSSVYKQQTGYNNAIFKFLSKYFPQNAKLSKKGWEGGEGRREKKKTLKRKNEHITLECTQGKKREYI